MSINAIASTTVPDSAATKPVAQSTASAPKPRSGQGSVPIVTQSADDVLAETLAAAKRRVQNLVGAASVDLVVSDDGSINYQKLAELVNEQNIARLANSNERVADLLA